MKSIIRTAAFAAIGLAGSWANADSITVTNIADDTTDFGYLSAASNSDPLLVDLNGGGETINGAVFTGGGASGTGAGGVSYALTGNSITPYNSYNNSATDPGVHTLLTTFLYGGGAANNDETLTINGLTPGDTATITVLGAAFGNDAIGGRSEQVTGSQGATTTYEENNGELSTLAYTAVVPVGGTLSILSHSLQLPNHDTLHYYGFTVSQVPEPASLSLLGLGAFGLLARRRKA